MKPEIRYENLQHVLAMKGYEVSIITVGDSKRVQVYYKYWVNSKILLPISYSTEFTDSQIFEDEDFKKQICARTGLKPVTIHTWVD